MSHPLEAAAARPLQVVLAATDFSPTAVRALVWAAGLALRHGARLEVVHVVHPLEYPIDLDLPPDVAQRVVEAARGRLARGVADLAAPGLAIGHRVVVGQPFREIVGLGEEIAADLVVLGTRGLSPLPHLLLGSTAERVVQRAGCPVLCVHPSDVAVGDEVRRVLLPTDFSAGPELALRAAIRLFRPVEGLLGLVLLHAWRPPDIALHGYGATGAGVWESGQLQRDAARELERLAEGLRAGGHEVETLLRCGEPAEQIVAVARERAVDAIALATHGRTGLPHLVLGSTAERVVHHADRPVLTVRLARVERQRRQEETAGSAAG